ncbi:hypothetical protein B0H16DRAFT_1890768 [Mycena metata]|uniref:Uncharacterized protein n=1 Tax=Mycena metata TaxID=1033252 RepID=A0AAD7IEP6_9AGAR|nr:hypothetical protein B0H16DRAFT_1890768 [Mycena metata]
MKFSIVLSALLSAITAVSGLVVPDSDIVSRNAAIQQSEHPELIARLCARAKGEEPAGESDKAADAAAGDAVGFTIECC